MSLTKIFTTKKHQAAKLGELLVVGWLCSTPRTVGEVVGSAAAATTALPSLIPACTLPLPAAEAQAKAESLAKQLAAAEGSVACHQAELKQAQSQLEAWQGKVSRGGLLWN